MISRGTAHPLVSKVRATTVALIVLFLGMAHQVSPAQAAHAEYRIADSNPAGSYRIDPDHSSVTFTIGHAGVATMVGRFDKISGHYRLDPKNPSRTNVRIEIAANSIDSNHPMRDKDLRGPDFLDANTFPTIRFVASRYRKTGEKSGVLTGKLTLHGKTRTVSLKIHEVGAGDVSALPKPWGGYLSGYDAEGTIRRSDFGIRTYPKMIGDRLHLYISVEGIRTKN
jgi:polyisoprenoid-binding protein YceI